jgi:hypothetical protein
VTYQHLLLFTVKPILKAKSPACNNPPRARRKLLSLLLFNFSITRTNRKQLPFFFVYFRWLATIAVYRLVLINNVLLIYIIACLPDVVLEWVFARSTVGAMSKYATTSSAFDMVIYFHLDTIISEMSEPGM